MKALSLLLMLLASLLSCSKETGDIKWTQMGVDASEGNTWYLDFETIKNEEGFIYYWILIDHAERFKAGHLSSRFYAQGDCKEFRFKYLNYLAHLKPMGKGNPDMLGVTPQKEWTHPTPDTIAEVNLKAVCSYGVN